MEAMLSNTFTASAKQGIRGGRAVTRNNMEGLASVQFPAHGIQEIEQPGVYRFNLMGAMVAQDMVDILQGLGQIVSLQPVDRLETLSRLHVVKSQRLFGCHRVARTCEGQTWEKAGGHG
jgi:hypothetical protein